MTIFCTTAAFMFGGIISEDIGIAAESATGRKIGIVESAAQDVDTTGMIEQTVSTFPDRLSFRP